MTIYPRVRVKSGNFGTPDSSKDFMNTALGYQSNDQDIMKRRHYSCVK